MMCVKMEQTYVRVLDVSDLPSANEGGDLVLFPALDRRRVGPQTPVVVEREDADAQQHGDAGGQVEDDHDDL